MNLDRLNLQLQEGAKGGGGGGDGGLVDVRSEFEDTALWEPTVVTDAAGKAVVSVTLPDNLTTWRLDGRGVTIDTKVGPSRPVPKFWPLTPWQPPLSLWPPKLPSIS